jgi:pilus assembly protein TadC
MMVNLQQTVLLVHMEEPLLDGVTLAAYGIFIASMITVHGMRKASIGDFLVLIMVIVGVPTTEALSLLPVGLGIM